MKIEIRGKYDNVTRKEMRYVLQFWAKILLGSRLSNNVYLKITFGPLSEGTLAYCAPTDWENRYHREFEFYIDPSLSRTMLFRALSHEMEHLRQYARAELKSCHEGFRWKGKMYNFPKNKKEYKSSPWEQEAVLSEGFLLDFYRKHCKLNSLKFAA